MKKQNLAVPESTVTLLKEKGIRNPHRWLKRSEERRNRRPRQNYPTLEVGQAVLIDREECGLNKALPILSTQEKQMLKEGSLTWAEALRRLAQRPRAVIRGCFVFERQSHRGAGLEGALVVPGKDGTSNVVASISKKLSTKTEENQK